MTDEVVIDRKRLVSLQTRLWKLEPTEKSGLHDDWVFAMQNVANMLRPDASGSNGYDPYVTTEVLDKALNTLTGRIMALEQRQALLSQLFAEEIQSHDSK
jgi:hypothetical protein